MVNVLGDYDIEAYIKDKAGTDDLSTLEQGVPDLILLLQIDLKVDKVLLDGTRIFDP